MKKMFLVISVVLGAAALMGSEGPPEQAASFEKSIQPVLEARCYRCHGPEKQKSGLRLDSRNALLAGGSQGPALVPGDPKGSLLVLALHSEGDLEMPPDGPLEAMEIAAIEGWIREGAAWGTRPPEAKASTVELPRIPQFRFTGKRIRRSPSGKFVEHPVGTCTIVEHSPRAK